VKIVVKSLFVLFTVLATAAPGHAQVPKARTAPAPAAAPAPAPAPAAAPQADASGNSTGWIARCTSPSRDAPLECAMEQTAVLSKTGQLIVLVNIRVAGDTRSPVALIQLPLGISLTEPVQLKVDNGTAERYPVQTCTNVGCIVSVPLKDPLMAAMRTGTLLKISIQDTNKRTINIDVPLLGFGLAFDKAK